MSVSKVNEEQLPGHKVLRHNNDEIYKWLTLLKQQREELMLLIQKQEAEKKYLKTEIDRIRYKYQLVTKSLNQRIMNKERYDQTITEAEVLFKKIVVSSNTLLGAVKKDAGVLEETINKKVGTESFTKTNSKCRTLPVIMESPVGLLRPEHEGIRADMFEILESTNITSQVDCVFHTLPKGGAPTESIKNCTLLNIGTVDRLDSADYISDL